MMGCRLRLIADKDGASAIGGIGSTRTTNEEAYLFQKLLREGIGTPNVDRHHGYFAGPRDPVAGRPWMMTNSIADIEKAAHIVLVASDPYERQRILNLRIKKAMQAGAKIYIVNEGVTELDRFAVSKISIPQNGAGMAAKILLKGVLSGEIAKQYEDIRNKIQGEPIRASEEAFGLETTTQLQQLADTLAESRGAIILYDEMATLAPGCKDLAADLQALAVLTGNVNRSGSGIGPLFEDANSLGARDMALLPQPPGAKADWEILVALENVLGQKWTYNSPQEVLLEIANTNPFYTGLTWEDLGVRTQEQEGSVLLSEANRATREGKGHA